MRFVRIILVVLALCSTALFVGCADEDKNVSSDEIGLKYSGGSIEGKKFTEIREPGATDYWNNNDPIYKLPMTQRSYVIRNDTDRDEGNDPDVDGYVSVPVLDPDSDISTMLNYELALTFKVNTNTDDMPDYEGGTLRQFFEQICRAYKCWINEDGDMPAGWRKMLREKFFAALEAAFKDNARK
nr:hypothetical protein [bacterium]